MTIENQSNISQEEQLLKDFCKCEYHSPGDCDQCNMKVTEVKRLLNDLIVNESLIAAALMEMEEYEIQTKG